MGSAANLLNKFIIPAAQVGTQVYGGIQNNRATNSAVNKLTTGANTAMNTINTGAQTARQTLADVWKAQRATLQPFEQAGTKSLADLSAGVAPGGGLADPFSYDMNQFWNDPQIQRRIAEGNKLLARKQASGGSLSSGAALKAARDYNDYQIGNEFGKERSAQEEIFRANQQQKYNALMGVTNLGANAANEEVRAGGTYGANLSNLETGTAEQIAGLQTDLASAQAAGDIQKANAITDTINGILGTVDKAQTAASLATTGAKVAGGIGSAAALAPSAIVGAIPHAAMPTLAAIQAGAVPEIASSAIGVGQGSAAPVASTGALHAITGFLSSNPWTIPVAAGIIGVTAWIKSQAHHEANEIVQKFQNPFDQKMDQLNRSFLGAAQSGQLTKQDALKLREAATEAIGQYKQKLAEFEQQGSDDRKVVQQARATADQWYGPDFSKWLGNWDSLIQQLPGAA